MSVISLPVSIGEALDKLTILDIKCEKIHDGRRESCRKEYDMLYKDLKMFIDTFPWHYKILREINLDIWNLQDSFHGKDISEMDAGKICTKILKENDRRFRIKSKINVLMSSALREQKGYAKNKAFFYGHLGLGDMFWLVGAVRYLSTCYDEVVVVCKEKFLKNVILIYKDDPTITFCSIVDDYVIQPFQQKIKPQLEANGHTVYSCGYHSANPRIYEFPLCFYDDLKLARNIRTEYFYVETTKEAEELYTILKQFGKPYVLIHQQSANKKMPIYEYISRKNGDTQIFLDVNENHYSPEHPFYTMASLVVNQPLLTYKLLLENAQEIHLLESSLYCFASHLDLSKVNEKVCYDSFDNSNERLGIFKTGKLE